MPEAIGDPGYAAKILPTFFVSHGGGPSYLMDSRGSYPLALADKNSRTCKALRSLVETELGGVAPRAIVIVSAHHEARGGHEVTPRHSEKPGLLYDYGGFPAEFYNLSYSPRGSAEVAAEVLDALRGAQIPVAGGGSRHVKDRGFDHGVFVPLIPAFPTPPPMVQVSLDAGMDADAHLRLGAALAPLRRRGVLVVGSGALTHNFPAMFRPTPGGPPPAWFPPFAQWLESAVVGGKDDAAARKARARELRECRSMSCVRQAHPTPEHFLPLSVAATAGSGRADSVPRGKVVVLEKEPSYGFAAAVIRYD